MRGKPTAFERAIRVAGFWTVLGLALNSTDAGVLFQGFYFVRNPAHPDFIPSGVPSRVDGSGPDDWWDHLAKQAESLRHAGFTSIWLPCVLKGATGGSSNGYDPFDDYDLGSKDQRGGIPTHFGTPEELERCVAIYRACGIDVYVDLVDNHRDGDPNGDYEFNYVNAFGHPSGGRFQKSAADFHHRAPPSPTINQDPNVYEGAGEGERFGRDLAPITGVPKNRVFNALIEEGDRLTRALDLQGYRIDDVKGISTDWLRPFLNSQSMKGKFAVGEFWSSSDDIEWWIANPMQGRASGFDYPLHFVLRDMCQGHGFFDMTQLDHAGLVGRDPLRTVTFVENHDTDGTSSGIIQNKALAYAYIMTSEGYPCVYYRDYSSDPGCYGLHQAIDNLIWIHEKLADGPTQQRWKDSDVFAFERIAGRHLLVGLNDNESTDRTVTVDTGFGARVLLHDYTGHRGDIRTDDAGRATLVVPDNSQGSGYVCNSVTGVGDAFALAPQTVTQDYEGAADLDIRPAQNSETVTVCRVWSGAKMKIKATLKPNRSNWSGTSRVNLELVDPKGKVRATIACDKFQSHDRVLDVRAKGEGFYSLRLRSNALPDDTSTSYVLSVSYKAPAKLR